MRHWLIGATGLGIVLAALSIDTESTRARRVGHFTLVERVRVVRQPYTHIAESGGDAWLPVPLRSETIRSHSYDEPWRIVSTTGRVVPVPPPPRESLLPNEGHDYPFDYWMWANDGLPAQELLLLAHTHGWRPVSHFPRRNADGSPVTMTSYVRTWAIDPRTGESRVLALCEMPFTERPNWNGYGSGCDQVKSHR